MSEWIKVKGRLEIIGGNVRIILPLDLIKYYQTLVDKHFKMFTHLPAHGAHITIASEKLHKNVKRTSLAYARNTFGGKPLEIEYNPEIIVGGWTKDFKNFYMKTRGEVLEQLKRILEVDTPSDRFHCTICNTKGGVRPYILK